MPSTVRALSRKASKNSRALFFSGKTDAEVAELLRTGGDGFLWTAEWRALRERVIQHYGGTCMKCGKTPKRGVNVDHIKPRKTHPWLALDFDNTQVLCGRCNKAKGNKHCTDYRPRL